MVDYVGQKWTTHGGMVHNAGQKVDTYGGMVNHASEKDYRLWDGRQSIC